MVVDGVDEEGAADAEVGVEAGQREQRAAAIVSGHHDEARQQRPRRFSPSGRRRVSNGYRNTPSPVRSVLSALTRGVMRDTDHGPGVTDLP